MYNPALVMVPGLNELPAGPATDHVTALLDNPETLALNWSCAPIVTDAFAGVTEMLGPVGLFGGGTVGATTPPPLQPENANAHANAMAQTVGLAARIAILLLGTL